jgi:hypothetical protein
MQIQFATKKVDGAYEVALLVDGMFKRSGVGKDVLALLTKLVGPILASKQDEGTEVAVNIGILTAAEVAREETRQERKRQTQEAEQEAQEIAALTAATKKEKDARGEAIIEANMKVETRPLAEVLAGHKPEAKPFA